MIPRLLLAALSVTACVVPAAAAHSPLEYIRAPISARSAPEVEGKRSLERIEFTGVRGTGDDADPTDVLHLYPGSGPLVLVLPISSDPNYRIARSMCRHFVSDGFRCAFLERHMGPEAGLMGDGPGPIAVRGFPPLSALSGRRALDVLEQRGVLRTGEKVALAGVSLGAIDAALMAAVDGRIGAAALLLGGGNLAKMMANIGGVGVANYVRVREALMRKNGLDQAQVEEFLAARTWGADPATYYRDPLLAPGNRLAPEKFLLINVKNDPAVPNECTMELCRAISRDGVMPDAEMVSLPVVPGSLKHVGGILVMGRAKDRMSAHFRRFLP